MPAGVQACRVAIAGATSLLGKDLKQWIEESNFAAGEVRLLDEDIAAGTLTDAGGEPTLVQAVDEESFEGVRFAFFAGAPAFSARHWQQAERAGATVIDLSGGLAALSAASLWIPALDEVLPAPFSLDGGRNVFASPAAPAIAACSLAVALHKLGVTRLALLFFQPVSECGQAGIEALESQTVKLLSFQPIDREVFDAQVAFNLLDRYGEASDARLAETRSSIARQVRAYLAGRVPVPAIQLIQAPVFYSYAFTAFAEFTLPSDLGRLGQSLAAAGIKLVASSDPQPTNMSVAGESQIVLGSIDRDPNVADACWFWGGADNFRLVAANAVSIAERLLAR